MTNKKKFEKLKPIWDAMEEHRWHVLTQIDDIDETHDEVEIETWSPAGEDLILTLYLNHWEGKSISEQVYDIYLGFDVEENVKMWLDAKAHGTGGVPSVQTLVHDAEEIEKMYDKLYDIVKAAEDELPDDWDSDDDENN